MSRDRDEAAPRVATGRPDERDGVAPASIPWAAAGLAGLVVAATAVSFWPSLVNGFVEWDDDDNLLNNPYFRGLGWEQVRWAFTSRLLQVYQPLAWLAYGAQYVLSGLSPRTFHAASLGLHAANAVVFLLLARRLLFAAGARAEPLRAFTLGAAIASSLFAVHPLRVECVAWASGQPYLLASLFLLLSVVAYLRAAEAAGRGARLAWQVASWGLYAASLLSKAVGIPLPALLLLIDVYPLRRLPANLLAFASAARRVWLEKLPYVALAAGAVAAGVWANAKARGVDQHSAGETVLIVLYGAGFYLWKTVVPLGLSPVYQMPETIRGLPAPFLLAACLVLGVSVLAVGLRRRWPWLLAAWAAYLIQLAPVLGFVRHIEQIAADRYTYLGCLAWALIAGGAATRFAATRGWGPIGKHPARGGAVTGFAATRRGARSLARVVPRLLAALACAAAIAALGLLTSRQTRVWHDSVRLWEHALAQSSTTTLGDSKVAWSNLGVAYATAGAPARGVEPLRHALALAPGDPDVHVNLASAYRLAGDLPAAIRHFRRAIEIDPSDPQVFRALGNCLARVGSFREAIAALAEGARRFPDDPELLDDLALQLGTCPRVRLRDPARAVALAERAVRLTDGRSIAALRSVAALYSLVGRFGEAAAAAERAESLARSAGEPALLADVQREVGLYRQGKPYRAAGRR